MTPDPRTSFYLAQTEREAVMHVQRLYPRLAASEVILRHGTRAWLPLFVAATREGVVDTTVQASVARFAPAMFEYRIYPSFDDATVDRMLSFVEHRLAQNETIVTRSNGTPFFVVTSGTSEEAAKSMTAHAPRLRDLVYEALCREPDTDEGISERLGLMLNTARPRRVELVGLGLIHAIGTRRSARSRRLANVWGPVLEAEPGMSR